MSAEIGKKDPCFGDFKCPRCYKKWQSSKAWADYGQQCKSCSTKVMPSELRKLFVYICSNCQARWNWAYDPQGKKCNNCSSLVLVRPLDRENAQDRQFIKAHRLRGLSDVGNDHHIDPNKEHRQDLCGKCQKLGRPCRQTAGQNYVTTPNTTSFVGGGTNFSFTADDQYKQRTSPTYSSSLSSSSNKETVYQQNITNRSSISNTSSSPSFPYSSTHYSTPSSANKYLAHDPVSNNNPGSDSWCIIL